MATTFDGAFIRQQGVEFAVVVVRRHVIASTTSANRTVAAFAAHLGRPVVLMAQDSHGHPTWYGRRDISRFMSRVPLAAIRWRRITIS